LKHYYHFAPYAAFADSERVVYDCEELETANAAARGYTIHLDGENNENYHWRHKIEPEEGVSYEQRSVRGDILLGLEAIEEAQERFKFFHKLALKALAKTADFSPPGIDDNS